MQQQQQQQQQQYRYGSDVRYGQEGVRSYSQSSGDARHSYDRRQQGYESQPSVTSRPLYNQHQGYESQAPATSRPYYNQQANFDSQAWQSQSNLRPIHNQPPTLRSEGEIITSVHISGFPSDLKERELLNLVRFLPYFEDCSVSSVSGSVFGFVKFATQSAALDAVTLLDRLVFDPHGGGVDGEPARLLRASLAKRNMRVHVPGTAKELRIPSSNSYRDGGESVMCLQYYINK